ncbi:nucleotidyltransferase family protein [Helcobacillus massiliensis]
MGGMEELSTNAPVEPRLRITHALLQDLADGCGADVLHIKGSAIHPELAEGRGVSSDCDVLVRPAHVAAYLAAMKATGWEMRTSFEQGSVFAHAATLYHPVWGTTDLHRSYPGLAAEAADVFTALWAQRDGMDLGGRTVQVPSRSDQALLLLMHAARSDGPKAEHDFDRTWTSATAQERAALEARAGELQGLAALLVLTDEGDGVRRERARSMQDFHLWDAVISGANPTEVWSARLQDARGVRGKLAVAWSAAHINRDHLALRLGHQPSDREVRQEWLDRLRRGGRRLLQMVRRRS